MNNQPETEKRSSMQKFGRLNELFNNKEATSQIGGWTGSISVDARRVQAEAAGDEDFTERLERARDSIGNYFRHASKSAPTRCIDGRPKDGYDPEVEEELGAQVPGGTVGGAIAYRSVVGVEEGAFLIDDIQTVVERISAEGYSHGGHISDHHGEGDTGCGAIDKANDILHRSYDEDTVAEIQFLTESLMGEDFDEDVFTTAVASMREIEREKRVYMQKDQTTGQYLYKQRAIDTLYAEANDGLEPVECLIGDHNETDLVINFVPGTTFDRDAYAHSTENEFQAFNYDVWKTVEMAKVIFPEDDEKQQKYIYARVVNALATAMVLTDGSLNLIVRKEEN